MPTVPTSQRIVQYLASKIGSVEQLQATLEAYSDAANTKPAAKTQIDAAYTKLQEVQTLLIAALTAQVTD